MVFSLQFKRCRSFAMSSVYMKKSGSKVLTLDTINSNVLKVQYAVRGPIAVQAANLEDQLSKGIKKSFEYVLRANIGDCHAVGQKPLSFVRQVLAACVYPDLIPLNILPADVVERATSILNSINGSVGCYSDSFGLKIIRKWVADFISQRDGFICNKENIIMTNGASSAVKLIFTLLMYYSENPILRSGFIVPIPQYPLYSATISELNGQLIGYYLKEDDNWSIDINEIRKSLNNFKSNCQPKALVVINPGNPTGQLLSVENMKQILQLCYEENIVLIADEVYQENVYASNRKFVSFKKVLSEMPDVYSNMELLSLHSASKGFSGECGLRGGYVECHNIDEDVMKQLQKLQSANLGSSVLGQITFGAILNSPKPNEPSYEIFEKEKKQILDSLANKASLVYRTFNSIEGVSCNVLQGAMYAFVKINLPRKLIEHSLKLGLEPDEYYCQSLLENTGYCTVPGSGFGQKENTYHFRTTILPDESKLSFILQKFSDFHKLFISSYS